MTKPPLLRRCGIVLSALLALTIPSFGQDCWEERDSYANCVFRLETSRGKGCDQCRINTFDVVADDTECDDLQGTLCKAVHSCDCGDCKDELEAFWQCTTVVATNETCGIECFTELSETPSGPLCPNEFDDYRNCVFDELPESEGNRCDACRLAASSSIPADVTECSVVQEIFCQAVEKCPCGPCSAPLEEYLHCDVYKRWFGECEVQCGVASSARAQMDANEESSGKRVLVVLLWQMVATAGALGWLIIS